MVKVEGRAGDHFVDAADRAIRLLRVQDDDVVLSFNEVELPVTRDSTVRGLYEEYQHQCEQRAEAYRSTPEYKERERRREEHAREQKRKFEAAIAKAPPSMSLRDPAGWKKACDLNQDPYGGAVMRYAETWARLMEGMLSGGAKLEEVAEEASHLADTEGITGFMYVAAVGTLARVWVHGDELRRWHNKEYGVDEEKAKGGTVNPAMLTVG